MSKIPHSIIEEARHHLREASKAQPGTSVFAHATKRLSALAEAFGPGVMEVAAKPVKRAHQPEKEKPWKKPRVHGSIGNDEPPQPSQVMTLSEVHDEYEELIKPRSQGTAGKA